MTVETLTRAEFARELGYVDADGNPSDRAIAQLLRNALGRWGLSPKRAVVGYARDQLRAGDVPADGVPKLLERLVVLGECAEVAVGHESFIAPAEPRWFAVGGGRAVLLGGSLAVPAGLSPVAALPPDDVAVRVTLDSEEAAATLDAGGWRQVLLAEWLHPPGYLRHVARREGDAVRGDQWDLARFWERLVSALVEEGLQLGPDAELRAVVGAAGSFFAASLPRASRAAGERSLQAGYGVLTAGGTATTDGCPPLSRLTETTAGHSISSMTMSGAGLSSRGRRRSALPRSPTVQTVRCA